MVLDYVSVWVGILAVISTFTYLYLSGSLHELDTGAKIFTTLAVFTVFATLFHAVFYMTLAQILLPFLLGTLVGAVFCTGSAFEKWLLRKSLPIMLYFKVSLAFGFVTLAAATTFT